MIKTKDDFIVPDWEVVVGWVPNFDALSITYANMQLAHVIFGFQISGIRMDAIDKSEVEWERFMNNIKVILSTIETYLEEL